MPQSVRAAVVEASGRELALAEALAKRGDWQLHLLDVDVKAGEQVESERGEAAKSHTWT